MAPRTPISSDTITAHCHEKARYRIRNPNEIIKIVDFDVSVLMLCPAID
jgi:hypothetical protein